MMPLKIKIHTAPHLKDLICDKDIVSNSSVKLLRKMDKRDKSIDVTTIKKKKPSRKGILRRARMMTSMIQ